MSNETIAAIVIALIASSPGLLALIAQRKRDNVDSTAKISDAALNLIRPYQERVQELEKKLMEMQADVTRVATALQDERQKRLDLERKVDEILAGAHRLKSQVESLGGRPVYVPPDRRTEYDE